MLFTERNVLTYICMFLHVYAPNWWRTLQHLQWTCEFSKQIVQELPPSLFDIRINGWCQGHPVFSPSWGPSSFRNWYVLMVFSVFLRGQGPEIIGRGMAYATDNHSNHNKSASSWFFTCGFCSVGLLMSIWGGGAPGRENDATHITETMPIAIGSLAMWKVHLASCNVQWANRNYGFFLFVDFDRNPLLPKPHVEHAAIVSVGGMVFKPEIFPEVFPTNWCMHNPISKSTETLPFYGCGVGVYESVSFM